MKVFITGATGYIGNHLLKRLLDDGFRVHALIRNPLERDVPYHPNLTWFGGDLLQPETIEAAMKGCEVVYHTAGYARGWAAKPQTYYESNVMGSLNVFETAARLRVRRVIYTGTAGVYSFQCKPVCDDRFARIDAAADHYVLSKLIAEHAALRLSQTETEVIILCPARVYGPGVTSRSNPLYHVIRRILSTGRIFVPGNGEQVASYCYIDDVADAHISAMTKGRTGSVYLLGGDHLSFRDLARLISGFSGKKLPVYHLSIPVIRVFIALDALRSLITGSAPWFSSAWLYRLRQSQVISSEKAQQELNYTLTPVTTGIRNTVNWIMQHPATAETPAI